MIPLKCGLQASLSLSIFCCSVAKLRPILCNTMDCSTPCVPVLHYLSPAVCSDTYPLSRWCHPTISSSVISSSCLQSFPPAGSFPSQWFASRGQSFGVSASASDLPMNIQGWFPLGWTGLTFLQSKGLSRVLQHHSSKASIHWHSAFFRSNSHIHTWLLEKPLLRL